MKKIYRDFIEYNGINIDTDCNLKNFNQLNIDYNLRISQDKPVIQNISKVWIEGSIDYHETIKTPVGKSLHGQISTGFKLLVSGEINIKIEYFSDSIVDAMHTVEGKFPFCNYITLPANFSSLSVILPYVYIEDVHCDILNPRTIYNNVSLILSVDLGE
ncbi:MAG: SPOCS domain-containing protein [Romboutsia sp.]|uniref:SPOCS domain-containing protein n=1 Tax=Romboutsia sp. TaxID=1965302 RepID=UPI003F2F136F